MLAYLALDINGGESMDVQNQIEVSGRGEGQGIGEVGLGGGGGGQVVVPGC